MSLVGAGQKGRKETVWKMRVSSRLIHKQDGLVEEAERQRGAAMYTEETAAKSSLDGQGKREEVSASLPGALGLLAGQHAGSAPARGRALRCSCRERWAAAAWKCAL